MKKKLKDLNQTHGRLEPELDENPKFTPTTLDMLWHGDQSLAKYKTIDSEEYKSQLSEMNTSDLRSHASRLGIMPITNRERLVKRLLLEFGKYVNAFRHPGNPPVRKASKEVMDILAEAKS